MISILFFNCNDTKKYSIISNTDFILLSKNKNQTDSIKILKNQKAKLFFAIDPECPLCRSYSKTINTLHNKYQDDIDFYGFLPSPVFLEEKMNEFIKEYYFQMDFIIDTNQILTNFLNESISIL